VLHFSLNIKGLLRLYFTLKKPVTCTFRMTLAVQFPPNVGLQKKLKNTFALFIFHEKIASAFF
jgi:hypothetical protein